MISRRNFLKTSALTLGGMSLPSLISCAGGNENKAAEAAAPAPKEFIGLQTYSLGAELAADVPGGLAKVKSFGYTDLELAGYNNGRIHAGYGDGDEGYAPADYKKLCDDLGLNILSAHLGTPSQYKTPEAEFTEAWKKTVEDHVTLGCTYIVDPSMPQCATIDEVKQACDRFNLAGKICKEAGIQFGYHNHNNEFTKLATPEQIKEKREEIIEMMKKRFPQMKPTDEMINGMMRRNAPGTMYEQLYMDNTDPELVCFQLDVYWCMIGDQDPCEWITEHSDRIKLLHIKDRWIIGDSGMMNWKNIFTRAKAVGIKHFFVELESDPKGRKQFEGVETSAQFLASQDYVW